MLGSRGKRSGLELAGLAQSLAEGCTALRWVHSDAMLASVLTTQGDQWQAENYDRGSGYWKLVHGGRFMGAKSHRRIGTGSFGVRQRGSGRA